MSYNKKSPTSARTTGDFFVLELSYKLPQTHPDSPNEEKENNHRTIVVFFVDDGEEVGSADIEETPSGDRHKEGGEGGISDSSEKCRAHAESERDSESKGSHEESLYLVGELRFSEEECERKRDGNLMDSDPYEHGVSELSGDKECGCDSNPIKNSVNKKRDPGHPGDVMIVTMILHAGVYYEEVFEEINREETTNKSKRRITIHLDALRENMHKRDGDHRSSPECDKIRANIFGDPCMFEKKS